MSSSKSLNILGCVPELLNNLLELAETAKDYNNFNIFRNIPVGMDDLFHPSEGWSVRMIDCFEDMKIEANGDFALSVVGTKSKKLVYDFFKSKFGFQKTDFVNLIHPSAFISDSASIDFGLQMEYFSSVSSCSNLGFGVNIKRGVSIGHHCQIGDFTTFNPGVTLSGKVIIGAGTMIGTGALIKDGIAIGRNSIVGVGSVVVKNIPDNVVAFGNPCRVVRKILN